MKSLSKLFASVVLLAALAACAQFGIPGAGTGSNMPAAEQNADG